MKPVALVIAAVGAFALLLPTSSAGAFQSELSCTNEVEIVVTGEVSEGAVSVPGQTGSGFIQGDSAAQLTVEQCKVDELDPAQPAETDYREPGDGDGVVTVSDSGLADNCVETFTPYSDDPDITYTPYCIKWRVCGGERVDDIVSGEIAGDEADGQYRSYLDQIVGLLEGAIDLGPSDPSTVLDTAPESVSEFLLEQGLDERPEDDLIPVFYWCAEYSESAGVRIFDPVDLGSVAFGWDLTYDEVYDIPGAQNTLFTQLQARLDLYDPDIGLVPDTDVGFTFVQWPTWLFLQNPSEDITLFATNTTDTLRVDLRATLIGVDWEFGDELVKTCAPQEMVPYTDDLDPIEHLPDCHHRFTQLDCQNLTATTRFKIEQMIRTRPSSSGHEYPAAVWSDFLDTPTEIALSSTVDDYEVHEIVAVNTVQGLTSDDLLAQRRAVGTLPQAGQACAELASHTG